MIEVWRRCALRCAFRTPLALVIAVFYVASASAQQAAPDPEFVTYDIQQDVQVTADFEETLLSEDVSARVVFGRVNIRQGQFTLKAARAVVFHSSSESGHDVLVYAEDASWAGPDGPANAANQTFRMQSVAVPQFNVANSRELQSQDNPVFRRAESRLFPESVRATRQVSMQLDQELVIPPVPGNTGSFDSASTRRIQIRPRSSQPLKFESFTSNDTVPAEQVYVITGGVNVLIEGVELDVRGQQISPGIVDLSADRIVIWTEAGDDEGLEGGGLVIQSGSAQMQLYMEGNIVIRHRQNTISATHAFFDANNDNALMLNAELRAFMPTTGGYFRVRAERLRQLSRDRFHAQNAWGSTSPYGKPGYRIQSSDVFVEPGSAMPWTGVDPLTGQQVVGQSTWVTSLNNTFVVGDVPLMWLPKISGPIEDPGIPIRTASVTSDSIFGLQVRTVWNLTRILGLPGQSGTEWSLLANYMSERGPGVGTSAEYFGQNGYGPYQGEGTLYYQYDNGTDNLGFDRRRLEPKNNNRGEATWRHRQQLPNNALLFGELGYLSDRNYLEQYEELRFDQDKDVETILGIRQDRGAWSGSLWTRPELYDFEANTQWLPRGDLYGLSQPLFGGLAYWSSHTSAGYADLHQMAPPSDPNDPYTPLGNPWYTDASGIVAMTRHEIDAPFTMGPVNIDPYVMGEAAYWDEGFTSDSVDRYLISAGVRARLFAWKIMPFVNSSILNLNGLAHKHQTMLEYSWTDVSTGLNEIPQYNEFDENSQERFRSRYTTQIFPGVIPNEFNPRNYAVRQGAGLWTSAPYHELADDQQVLRLSFRNRIETRAGPANAPRIRKFAEWESGLSWFPKADRDNFGEDFGLLYHRGAWHVNDRTSLMVDALWDLFGNAQHVWSVGMVSQRSTRGSVYVSYRQVEAARFLDSRIVTSSYSYQMSPKWISTGAYAYDVAEGEARGSSLTVSRVGLDWVLHMGFGYDFSKDNLGVAVSLEPRFGPPSPTNLSYLLGMQ
jgi:hypothetical protein